MSPDDIQRLIDKEQQAVQAIDGQIQTAIGRQDGDLATSLEAQKLPHLNELNRLQTDVLPKAQKDQADKEAKEAAEAARKDQKKKDNGIVGGLF